MFSKETYTEMLCPVCGKFYFSSLESDTDDLGYFSLLSDKIAVSEDIPTCHQCGWKYDAFQHNNPESSYGENGISLIDYRRKYSEIINENPDYSYLESQYTPEKHRCPVCGQHVFPDVASFEICPVCGWEDDPIMEDNPDFEGGANDLSLKEYKNRYYKMKEENPEYCWERNQFLDS